MGAFVSFFKRQSLADQLEEAEKAINDVRRNRHESQQRQKKLVARVTLWGLIVYTAAAAAFLLILLPPTWPMRILYSCPLLVAPLVVLFMRRGVLWYFSGVIKGADEDLRSLIDKKRTLLEQVREKEPYKKAKEILEKYDPETIKQKNMAEELQRLRSQSLNSQVRRRMPPNAGPGAGGVPGILPPQAGRTQNQGPPPPQSQQQPRPGSAPGTPVFSGHQPRRMPPGYLPPGAAAAAYNPPKTAFDRVVEYMVGDGPNNRYALICTSCNSHNGMALKEEFDFVGFRCSMCGCPNPPKKQRPIAPRIAPPTPPVTPVHRPTTGPPAAAPGGHGPQGPPDSRPASAASSLPATAEEEPMETSKSLEDSADVKGEGDGMRPDARQDLVSEDDDDESLDGTCSQPVDKALLAETRLSDDESEMDISVDPCTEDSKEVQPPPSPVAENSSSASDDSWTPVTSATQDDAATLEKSTTPQGDQLLPDVVQESTVTGE